MLFKSDDSLSWTQLRERTITHPSELNKFNVVRNQIEQLAGPDYKFVEQLLDGVGSVKFEGDLLVATSCQPHNCVSVAAVTIVDISNRQVFLAWRPEGKKIEVRPSLKQWSDDQRVELKKWAEGWR